jgi:hypothetical protein
MTIWRTNDVSNISAKSWFFLCFLFHSIPVTLNNLLYNILDILYGTVYYRVFTRTFDDDFFVVGKLMDLIICKRFIEKKKRIVWLHNLLSQKSFYCLTFLSMLYLSAWLECSESRFGGSDSFWRYITRFTHRLQIWILDRPTVSLGKHQLMIFA